ncbi:SDR family oxidoreductase [Microbacterium sp. M28]|uniref:SDR family NAD(P)-dependent oxidoreductase n=1 Tax=Microbacterium sp. M28 TaxID=2962064 RepID=UPI0021F3F854|nr:SDR family NAD(P)-dependent oxidoreductase [Microbacterium sp. M28]UYO98024.1 SDR family oxidoreductase [Microbacterium sp. M28]
MFDELRGRIVLVTGGASGIGAGIVDAFLGEGSTVISADLSFPEGLLRRQEHAWTIRLDVRDEDAVADAVSQIGERLGTIDTLVTAAGTSTLGFATETTSAQWDLNLDVNAKGSFLVAKHVAARLVDQERTGRIVFISSQAGKNGYRGMTAYVASKHAVLGVTKTMATELASRGITVNAICPGIIETPMKHRERIEGGAIRGMTAEEVAAEDRSQVPLGRTGTPEDVAGVALFLASDLAGYMTGQGINVTGGMTMH